MADAKSIAAYYIGRSSQVEENDLTNLKLQKILFYTQAEYAKNNGGKTFFPEDIEAWKFGPVISSVYNWLKGCGSYPITTFDVEADFSKLKDDEKVFLDSIWDKYYKYSAAYLVKKTHEEGGAWAQTFEEEVRGKVISLDKILGTKLQNEW